MFHYSQEIFHNKTQEDLRLISLFFFNNNWGKKFTRQTIAQTHNVVQGLLEIMLHTLTLQELKEYESEHGDFMGWLKHSLSLDKLT